jgi:hypothetical protein
MNTILKHDEKIQDPQSHDTRQHKNSSGKIKGKLEIAPRGNFVSFHGSGRKNVGFVAGLLRRGTFDILWNGQAPTH